MAHKAMSPNQREAITAVSSISGNNEYILSTNGAININGTIGGIPLPISGATTGVGVAILDSSGNQISSFGGGTQYTDGGVPPAHPVGNTIEWSDGSNWQTVSTTKPLPVTASFSPSGTQDVNVTKIGGNAITTTIPVSGTIAATQSGTWNVTNISGTISLPTGASTSALQTTGNTSLATIAALSKAEDAPHSSSDTGIPVWAVRNDTGAVFAGSDGDYIPLATDSTGALRVDLNGTISTNNSTTSVLAGGAAFTGTSEDALNYNEIRISVITSHVSATDGLSIQQSSDNTNWDITDTYTIPANTGKTYSVPRQARYFRLVYTNGATLQTSFRLQTIMNRLGVRVSSQRPNDAYSNETDLEQQQSFLMGYNGATWDRLRTTGTGVLTTSTVLTAGAAAIGSLTAGSAIIGKVGIDQTTPGTTNLVSLSAETTKVIGTVNQGTSPWVINTGSATAAAIPANAFYIAGADGSSNLVGAKMLANGLNTSGGILAAGNVAQFDDVSPTSITENNYGIQRMSANRNIYTTIRDAAGNERGVNVTASSELLITGAVTNAGTFSVQTSAQVPGTGATNLGKAEDAAHTTGDTGVFALGVRNDTLADTTNTTGDYAQLSTDVKGRVMIAGAPRALKGIQQTSVSNTTSETTIVTAVASTFLDVYGLILANTGASTTKVTIKDATAGTTRAIIEVPTLETRGFMLPVDAAIPQAAVNNNWTVTCGTATTALEVTAMYVKMV